jgi:hypothetical protein
MAELVNRTAAGRIECLYYLLLNLNDRFGLTNSFTLNEAKFSEDRSNVHEHCLLLKDEKNLGIKYCRYFTNALNKSGCALTNSLEEDLQKQKAVSNSIIALHGLGLIDRDAKNSALTKFGKKFATVDYHSTGSGPLISEAVTQYGPLVGMLGHLFVNKLSKFSTADISVGYPNSGDEIKIENRTVKISVGSQSDSNVRTRSVLLAWAVAGGFIEPASWGNKTRPEAHLEFRDYLLREKRTDKFYKVTPKVSEFFDRRNVISRPLDYEHLIKDIDSLREKGQEEIRNETKKQAHKIRSRRFAIIYLLNKSFLSGASLDFEKLINFLQKNPSYFVISQTGFKKIMAQELSIAFAAGIPFALDGTLMKPLNGVSEEELSRGAPEDLVEVLNSYV